MSAPEPSASSIVSRPPPRMMFSISAKVAVEVPAEKLPFSLFAAVKSTVTPVVVALRSRVSPAVWDTLPPSIAVPLPKPLRTENVSSPPSPTSVSAPAEVRSRSSSVPPRKLSSPSPPVSVSLPLSPVSVSLPAPPKMESAPEPAFNHSPPAPPVIVSSPLPAWTFWNTELPDKSMVSSSDVPLTVSMPVNVPLPPPVEKEKVPASELANDTLTPVVPEDGELNCIWSLSVPVSPP